MVYGWVGEWVSGVWGMAEQSQDVAPFYIFLSLFFFFVFHPTALCSPQHKEGGGILSFQNVALYDAQHRDAIDPTTTEGKRKSNGAYRMYK